MTAAEFIKPKLPVEGLSAWGSLTPDGSFQGELLGDWLWLEQVEQMTRKLKTACAMLGRHRVEAATTCWVYERARLYACVRPDQSCLVLLVENGAGAPSTRFNELLVQFARHA